MSGGPGSRSLARLDAEGVTTLARDIVTNRVFAAFTEADLRGAFGMFFGLAAGAIPKTKVRQVGLVWEFNDRSVPGLAANGYPIFFSAHLVHKADLPALRAELNRMLDALGVPDPPENLSRRED